MEVRIGASGWRWTLGDFSRYRMLAPFNAIEIDYTFYKIPSQREVQKFLLEGGNLKWAVKVHRSITHRYFFDENAIKFFRRFKKSLKLMEDRKMIEFYVFIIPPALKPSQELLSRIKKFISASNISNKAAFEFRSREWYSEEWLKEMQKLGITVVSVDAPGFHYFVKTTNKIYVRLHGRRNWFFDVYNNEELDEILLEIKKLLPADVIWIILDNDPGILKNGTYLLSRWEEILHI